MSKYLNFYISFIYTFVIRGCPSRTSAQNREKLTPTLVRKMSALAQPPSPRGFTINFEKYVFLHQKLQTSAYPPYVRKMSALDNLPWLRTSFMDGPLCVIQYSDGIHSHTAEILLSFYRNAQFSHWRCAIVKCASVADVCFSPFNFA